MSEFLVYALVDPRTEHIRYVGLSTRGLERPQEHFKKPLKNDHSHRANWLRGLLLAGLKPTIKVIEYCGSETYLSESEEGWISLLKQMGCPLTNHKSGGFNGKPSEETKIKMSLAQKGRTFSLDTRQKMGAAQTGSKNKWFGTGGPMFGKSHTPEARRKIAEGGKGRVPVNKGKKYTEEEKLRFRYRCSICKNLGHNKQACNVQRSNR